MKLHARRNHHALDVVRFDLRSLTKHARSRQVVSLRGGRVAEPGQPFNRSRLPADCLIGLLSLAIRRVELSAHELLTSWRINARPPMGEAPGRDSNSRWTTLTLWSTRPATSFHVGISSALIAQPPPQPFLARTASPCRGTFVRRCVNGCGPHPYDLVA